MIPEGLGYTTSHEWARREPGGKDITVGITHHAQEELKDIVFVELPAKGRQVTAGQPCAVVESVKAAFDIYAPVSGTVTRVNEELARRPALINEDCYKTGWFFVVEPSNASEWNALLTPQAYEKLLTAGHA